MRKMFIENNILKHYLKNVYFITGTAYAGKSTMVKILAEKYDLIFCGENYTCDITDKVADPETSCQGRSNQIHKKSTKKSARNL